MSQAENQMPASSRPLAASAVALARKQPQEETLPLNEGIAHVHELSLLLQNRLDVLSRQIQSAPVPEAVKAVPASSMQDQLMAAVDALGEAGRLLDSIAGMVGFSL